MAPAPVRAIVLLLLSIILSSSIFASASKSTTSSSSSPPHHTWPPLRVDWRPALAFLLVLFGASLGSAGGVGGGVIFVPTARLILQFDARTATALSNYINLWQLWRRGRSGGTIGLGDVNVELASLGEVEIFLEESNSASIGGADALERGGSVKHRLERLATTLLVGHRGGVGKKGRAARHSQ
ncbi:hypothetical protein L7F22_026777 [Adiantum nelumboides]|nr:hypothetical protein [Adiantum nelumboides]